MVIHCESYTNSLCGFFFPGWSGAHTHREQSPPEFKASVLDSKEPLHIPKPNLILTHTDPREPLQSNPAASIQKKRGSFTRNVLKSCSDKGCSRAGPFIATLHVPFLSVNSFSVSLRWAVVKSSSTTLGLSGGWRQHIMWCAQCYEWDQCLPHNSCWKDSTHWIHYALVLCVLKMKPTGQSCSVHCDVSCYNQLFECQLPLELAGNITKFCFSFSVCRDWNTPSRHMTACALSWSMQTAAR